MKTEQLRSRADALLPTSFGLFFRHWNLLILVLLGIAMGGFFSLRSMPLESAPELSIPIGTVTTVYPGSSPSDIEKLVTDRLEQALSTLSDVNEITSTSSEGVSVIVVEFEASADIDESIQKLRDEVSTAKSDLPEDAEDPVVKAVRADDESIITLSLVGNAPKEELKTYAEELQDEIETISGVSRVDIVGLERKEMQVLVNIQSLEGFGLSVADVVSAVGSEHLDLPVGSLQTDGFQYSVSWRGQFNESEALEMLVVASKNGQNIYLKDLAEVREVFAETSSQTKIYRAQEQSEAPSVTLQVYKQQGADLVSIADTVRERASEHKVDNIPDHMELLVTNDLSDLIREDIRRLLVSAMQTMILIGIVLFLAVGRKEATVAALSMPFLYLLSFIGLAFIGETFNFLVLFALIISLGVVVDNATVIVEGIYDNIKQRKMTPRNAALSSVSLYKAPLFSGTLTTIAAFVPLAMMTGIIGQYVSHIPKTINMTLIASLVSALFIVPPIAAKYLEKDHKQGKEMKPFLEPYMDKLKDWYVSRLDVVLHSKKLRRMWIAGMIVGLVVSFSLPMTGLLKVEMFPGEDTDYFFVSIETPQGSSLESTRSVSEKIEAAVRELPGLDYFISVYGGGPVGGVSGGGLVASNSSNSNIANITVNLVDESDRDFSGREIIDMFEQKISSITSADILVSTPENGPPSGAPVEMRITGEDLPAIELFAKQVQSFLETVEGTRDITNDIESSTGDFRITPKRDRLAYFGVSSAQVAQILRTSVFGNDGIKIIRSGEETPIVVRLDFRDEECLNDTISRLREIRDGETVCGLNPRSVTELNNLLIPTSKGTVALGELVDIELTSSVTTIRHQDRDTVVRVMSELEEDFVPGDVMPHLLKYLDEVDMPEGIAVNFGGENEDMAESFASLFRAVFVAIILIFAILVYQFDSFRQVFIIMFTIPFALIGVFFGLTLLRKNLSFPGMIGFAALAGIVVNDAIVFIDRINQNREAGMPIRDAVLLAGRERMQPIIITTLTTSLGMMPLMFSGDVFSDLAVTVSIGIVFSTLLTLVMVPVFYLLFMKDDAAALASKPSSQ